MQMSNRRIVEKNKQLHLILTGVKNFLRLFVSRQCLNNRYMKFLPYQPRIIRISKFFGLAFA